MELFLMTRILEQKMRKEVVTRPRRCFFGLTIVMAILIFLIFKQDVVTMFTEDTLPSAEDRNFSPKTGSIFFHETFSSGLGIRQACAVEAAAAAHPSRKIYVMFSKPVTKFQLMSGCLAYLRQFPNVKFLRVHEAEYSKGTVVHSLLVNEVVQSRFRITHTADILRILTLNKWGGIYLDTDMIVTRSLDDLPSNFLAKEHQFTLASGIIAFAKDEIGTKITSKIMKELTKRYNPELLSIGPKVIHKVIRRLCPQLIRGWWDLEDNRMRPFTDCKGVAIFNHELFYPRDYSQIDDIFNPPPRHFNLSRPYTYHMYNSLSLDKRIGRATIFDLVAKFHCPTIHGAYNVEFSAEVVKSPSVT